MNQRRGCGGIKRRKETKLITPRRQLTESSSFSDKHIVTFPCCVLILAYKTESLRKLEYCDLSRENRNALSFEPYFVFSLINVCALRRGCYRKLSSDFHTDAFYIVLQWEIRLAFSKVASCHLLNLQGMKDL